MGAANIYAELKREYEITRDNNRKTLRKRREEIYALIPRVREIDDLPYQTYAKIQKRLFDAGEASEVCAKDMEKAIVALVKEKTRLLVEAGFKKTYLDDVYSCRHCKDTGFVENGARCACYTQKLIKKRYGLSNLSEQLKRENFDNFDIRFYSEEKDASIGISPRKNMERIREVCDKFIKNFDTDHSANLLFYGGSGLGKTFLCSAIAKDLLDADKTVIYLTAPKLCKHFEDIRFNPDDYEGLKNDEGLIYKADLLIVDDLGSEFPTQLNLSALFDVINTRLIEKRHTIISSNIGIDDFERTYSDRMTSRLIGEYKLLRFVGTDIRDQKKYGGRR